MFDDCGSEFRFSGSGGDQGTGSNAEPCSFRRFPAKALIAEEFGGKPEWFRLAEDKASVITLSTSQIDQIEQTDQMDQTDPNLPC